MHAVPQGTTSLSAGKKKEVLQIIPSQWGLCFPLAANLLSCVPQKISQAQRLIYSPLREESVIIVTRWTTLIEATAERHVIIGLTCLRIPPCVSCALGNWCSSHVRGWRGAGKWEKGGSPLITIKSDCTLCIWVTVDNGSGTGRSMWHTECCGRRAFCFSEPRCNWRAMSSSFLKHPQRCCNVERNNV